MEVGQDRGGVPARRGDVPCTFVHAAGPATHGRRAVAPSRYRPPLEFLRGGNGLRVQRGPTRRGPAFPGRGDAVAGTLGDEPLLEAIIFWGLDGFFLWQEQLFRKLYDRVRVLPDDEVDFSMNTSVIKGDDRPSWIGATLSKTLIPFHGVLIFAVVVVMFLSRSAVGG